MTLLSFIWPSTTYQPILSCLSNILSESELLQAVSPLEKLSNDRPKQPTYVARPETTYAQRSATTSKPGNPSHVRQVHPRRLLENLQALSVSYLSGTVSRNDPPLNLPPYSGVKYLNLHNFVSSVALPSSNLWDIGVQLAEQLYWKMTDRAAPIHVDDVVLHESIQNELLLILGVGSNGYFGEDCLMQLAEKETSGNPRLDQPIIYARNQILLRNPKQSKGPSPGTTLVPFPSVKSPITPEYEGSLSDASHTPSTARLCRPTKRRPKISLSFSKSATLPPIRTSLDDTNFVVGSFSPTDGAEHRLRSFLSDTSTSGADSPAPSPTSSSPTPSDSWRPKIRARVRNRSLLIDTWSYFSSRDPPAPLISRSPTSSSACPSPPEPADAQNLKTPPASPSSMYRGKSSSKAATAQSDYLATPVPIDPLLLALEETSRLRAPCVCAVCGKRGSDYPRCPRCKEAWCSRDCRVAQNKGKRHVCRINSS